MSESRSSLVKSRVDAQVLTLTLDRPDVHNALNGEMLAQLTRDFAEAAENRDVRIVLLRAEGPNFSAGVDLSQMARLNRMSRRENVDDGVTIARMLAAAATLPQPLIAAIQGPVFGGGLALVCCSDIVMAADQAMFSTAETRLGLTPVLLTPYLVARVGHSAAKRLLLTASRIDAHEAHRIGLADEVIASAELDEAVTRLCRRLKRSSPGAIAFTKRILARGSTLPLTEIAMRDAAEDIATARAGGEAAEGIAAFLEKRSPVWAENL